MTEVLKQFDSRNFPFSTGGQGDRTAGSLIPSGPDPLFNVERYASDLKGLPWDRRPYDAWSTLPFRSQVLTWIANFFQTNDWVSEWAVREKGLQPGGRARLKEPLLIFKMRRKSDGEWLEVAESWSASERDSVDRTAAKLISVANTLNNLNS